MNIKLVACDFDGTLITSAQEITARTQKTIAQLKNKGIRLIFVTGRAYPVIANRVKDLSDLPIVCLNGAYIADRKRVYFERKLEKENVREALDVIQKIDWRFHVYTKDKIISIKDRFEPGFYCVWKHDLGENYQDVLITAPMYKSIVAEYGDDVYKVLIFNSNIEKLSALRRELEAYGNYNIVSSSENNIELIHQSVSKGKALKMLASLYNVHEDNIMAIGDGDNDISMLEYAGLGVAMGNAIDGLKAVADYITDSNENEGVAKALERFCL